MLTRLRLVLLLLLLLPGAAQGQQRIVISTGLDRGSYYYIGQRLKREVLLRNAGLPQVLTSGGSIENLARLDEPESPVNVALAQTDALVAYLVEHPDFDGEFRVLGDMGRECALFVTSAGGPASLADLKREGGALAVGAAGSGAAVTFSALRAIEADWSALQPSDTSVLEGLLELRQGGSFSSLRAALLVQRLGRSSPPLAEILGAPDAYRLLEVAPEDVPEEQLPDGSRIYTHERVPIGGAVDGKRPEVGTLCMRALLLYAPAKLTPETRDLLVTILLESRDTIAGGLGDAS